nr:zinc finger, CCHC-type [Tanacetum cinerariifolium]
MAENIVKEMTTSFGKLDKFKGYDFRRWQKKMHFLLMTLMVVYVLTTPMPELMEDDTVEAIRRKEKWENDDYICRGRILNGMSDSLFNVYQNVKSAKELWDSFKSKYMAEDASKESLKARDIDKSKGKEVDRPSVNMTEEGKNKNNKQNKGKKHSFKEKNSGSGSNKKPKLECWKCGKTGHFKRDRYSGNKKNANAGGSGKGLMQLRGRLILVLQLMFCKDRCWFKTYESMKDESVLYMGDDHFTPVHRKGSVVLNLDQENLLLC